MDLEPDAVPIEPPRHPVSTYDSVVRGLTVTKYETTNGWGDITELFLLSENADSLVATSGTKMNSTGKAKEAGLETCYDPRSGIVCWLKAYSPANRTGSPRGL